MDGVTGLPTHPPAPGVVDLLVLDPLTLLPRDQLQGSAAPAESKRKQ